MNAHRIHTGPVLVQETYYVEGKGWRTHHVISQTSSIELDATEDEIAAAKHKPKATPAPEPEKPLGPLIDAKNEPKQEPKKHKKG